MITKGQNGWGGSAFPIYKAHQRALGHWWDLKKLVLVYFFFLCSLDINPCTISHNEHDHHGTLWSELGRVLSKCNGSQ